MSRKDGCSSPSQGDHGLMVKTDGAGGQKTDKDSGCGECSKRQKELPETSISFVCHQSLYDDMKISIKSEADLNSALGDQKDIQDNSCDLESEKHLAGNETEVDEASRVFGAKNSDKGSEKDQSPDEAHSNLTTLMDKKPSSEQKEDGYIMTSGMKSCMESSLNETKNVWDTKVSLENEAAAQVTQNNCGPENVAKQVNYQNGNGQVRHRHLIEFDVPPDVEILSRGPEHDSEYGSEPDTCAQSCKKMSLNERRTEKEITANHLHKDKDTSDPRYVSKSTSSAILFPTPGSSPPASEGVTLKNAELKDGTSFTAPRSLSLVNLNRQSQEYKPLAHFYLEGNDESVLDFSNRPVSTDSVMDFSKRSSSFSGFGEFQPRDSSSHDQPDVTGPTLSGDVHALSEKLRMPEQKRRLAELLREPLKDGAGFPMHSQDRFVHNAPHVLYSSQRHLETEMSLRRRELGDCCLDQSEMTHPTERRLEPGMSLRRSDLGDCCPDQRKTTYPTEMQFELNQVSDEPSGAYNKLQQRRRNTMPTKLSSVSYSPYNVPGSPGQGHDNHKGHTKMTTSWSMPSVPLLDVSRSTDKLSSRSTPNGAGNLGNPNGYLSSPAGQAPVSTQYSMASYVNTPVSSGASYIQSTVQQKNVFKTPTSYSLAGGLPKLYESVPLSSRDTEDGPIDMSSPTKSRHQIVGKDIAVNHTPSTGLTSTQGNHYGEPFYMTATHQIPPPSHQIPPPSHDISHTLSSHLVLPLHNKYVPNRSAPNSSNPHPYLPGSQCHPSHPNSGPEPSARDYPQRKDFLAAQRAHEDPLLGRPRSLSVSVIGKRRLSRSNIHKLLTEQPEHSHEQRPPLSPLRQTYHIPYPHL
ncbi:unnamed protein product [Lymnaea stagnalis]|uniref:Uncharacterized protein n=1 Tax=Lymnaea stagnalis TaxID=6523 RepID=A0AAV2HQA2_LYMST